MIIAENSLDLIGNTPLVLLKGPSEDTGCEIWGKCEYANPGGSVKDRAALYIVRDAEANGLLRPGGTIVEGTAGDIVYSNLFTGVHGNYLRSSIEAAGLDPDDLPESDPSKMDFGDGSSKAWKDIWGSGQGIGAIKKIGPASDLIERLKKEYSSARQRMDQLPWK